MLFCLNEKRPGRSSLALYLFESLNFYLITMKGAHSQRFSWVPSGMAEERKKEKSFEVQSWRSFCVCFGQSLLKIKGTIIIVITVLLTLESSIILLPVEGSVHQMECARPPSPPPRFTAGISHQGPRHCDTARSYQERCCELTRFLLS
ncbi:hypothetical protein AAFF_G00329360 [Aldrovandia affinis]|uniref:Uncharacterized protein n=1 Tax=Aldrovandia affinis TaxID=143900 RepID=A0AAD7WQ89_9TELE|nr:hypothetical protein AAFF_G00329360 [Aldrovandia affinis]